MTSAATVVAADSTDVANLNEMDDLKSDFGGDWFRSEASQSTIDWIYADKRQEPLLTIDGRSQEVLADHGAQHTITRTLPVHTSSTAQYNRVLDFGASSGRLTHIPSGSSSNIVVGSPTSSPALSPPLSPPVMLVESQPIGDPEESKSEIGDREQKSSMGDEEPTRPSRLLPSTDESDKLAPIQHKRRLSWFRSNKSSSSLTVRSPMKDDTQSTWSRWRKAKLPRKLKIVFVGDGASGKTCLLM